ncbi:MAG: nitroreductase family protein [Promethearchaeota archaeon]|nr:MAG: nitroreductase family protein [Candidatus Lokiarchaeota archaeon]
MDIEEAIYKRRTIRRFKQESIPMETLKKLVDFARVAPSGSNVQGIEYTIVHTPEMRDQLFSLVRWASGLPRSERTPEEGRRPTAYIIVQLNTEIKKSYYEFDIGAAVENILLGAVKYGLGACWMGSINAKKIKELFEIPEFYEITHVISLGFSDEESVMEPYKDSFTYWKDDKRNMHVPKRNLKDIIYKIS